ncbi:hypothetical protein IGJ16_000170 [Enterococcus pernyi]
MTENRNDFKERVVKREEYQQVILYLGSNH